MRRLILWSAASGLVLVALSYAGGDMPWTFRGEIADSQCALNVHSLTRSHQEMLKSKSMGGTSASCALYCIKYLGGNLVLTSRKHVYHLDNQELAMKYVGEKVLVEGTLDSKTDTVHITKIQADQ
jgi:hypothetical protein